MAASSLGRRRPRPVADAPVLDGAALAKAWLVELVAVAPLERAAALPGPRFADDAPRLCTGVAAALSSEAAFDDLEPGGALAPLAAGAADLAAARDALEAVTALEALRATAWAAIVAELDRPRPETVADLADRLAAIVAALSAAALDRPAFATGLRPGDRGPLAAVLRSRPDDPAPADGLSADPASQPSDASAAAPPNHEPSADAPPLDAFAAPRSPDASAEAPSPFAAPPAAPSDATGATEPLDLSVERLYGLVEDAVRDDASPEIEDATEFTARRLAPWTAAIERRLIRHREDGLPFAVLCVELVDLDRLVAADRDGDVTEALETAEAAMCAQLRPADALVRERPGRYWLTTPDTDSGEARVLAHRIVAGVAAAPGHRGAPMQAAVGVAACPADGADAGELENRAEEGLFAARAAGVRVAP
jgi:hypothetical protein